MIGWLSGIVVEGGAERLVLDVNGVGYEVQVVRGTLGASGRAGEALALWIHTHASSESPAATLYGFATSDQRRVFRLLLKVKGIGPRLAQGIVSQLGSDGLVEAVRAGDITRLTTVSGVGKKTAHQLVLDLAGQLGSLEQVMPAPTGPEAAVTSALGNLGFKRAEIDRALATLKERGESEGPFEEVLRLALAHLREM